MFYLCVCVGGWLSLLLQSAHSFRPFLMQYKATWWSSCGCLIEGFLCWSDTASLVVQTLGEMNSWRSGHSWSLVGWSGLTGSSATVYWEVSPPADSGIRNCHHWAWKDWFVVVFFTLLEHQQMLWDPSEQLEQKLKQACAWWQIAQQRFGHR